VLLLENPLPCLLFTSFVRLSNFFPYKLLLIVVAGFVVLVFVMKRYLIIALLALRDQTKCWTLKAEVGPSLWKWLEKGKIFGLVKGILKTYQWK
jgi:hypothetical protein